MLEAEQIFQQRYQLKQKLGQNAGRQTWLAEDISIQPAPTVIVKFLAFGEQFQWQDLKLFEREADILKQLYHPHIPKYRDYFSIEDNNYWFALVQEYIPGESLKQLIENKQRFTEEELQKIATDVLEILCYLHTLNPQVIHRDIKPSNLILGEEKQIYLIDFGAVQDNATAKSTTFTVVGTYGYAPIEQFGGKTIPASDLYALGATLIHLATGIIPADLPQKKMRIQFRDRVTLSDNFIRWIEKLTEPDIEERFVTASQALKALNNKIVVHSSTEITQEQASRIKLRKSDSQLEIKIPSRVITTNNKYLGLLCRFLLIIYGGMIIFSPLRIILLFLAFLLRKYLLARFGEFYLRFNQDSFVMKWKILGFMYQQKMGKTSAIDNIVINPRLQKIDRNKFIKIISIQLGAKEYNFGGLNPQLTDSECESLVTEIKNWLDI